ncbi:MAG TPA: glycosyltransferase family 2 protein [Verrucomicrobiae bacterium]|nr:glycosyltransferase family 2 protein [Verrucomicrobiae bacterium]
MPKLPISVCMISGAEVQRIGQALDSVMPWTSECIVVLNQDAGDGTAQLAVERGAKVFPEPWRGFVAQKNSALAKATQPWVLGLDADEAVCPELRDEIIDFFAGKPERHAAYSFPRLTRYLGRWIRHGDWYPDRCVRLWQRTRGRWAGVDPHAALQVEGSVYKLRHDLFHFTADTLDRQVIKTMSYADDFVRHCQQTGRRVTFTDLLTRPAWRFARAYFFKLGLLDGWQGYTIAWMTSFYTFLRYAKAREAQLAKGQAAEPTGVPVVPPR